MDFQSDALGFLISYAKRHKQFCSEDVTLAAIKEGVAPTDLRQWGKVFSQAAKDGYIRRSKEVYRRSMGNGTLTLGWQAN